MGIYEASEGGKRMGKIAGAFIFPHPPIMVEEVGESETKRFQTQLPVLWKLRSASLK